MFSTSHAYAASSEDIDCDENTPVDYFQNQPKCKAIKLGSNAENKNWYICPKIWDLLENIPLEVRHLDFGVDGFESSFNNWRVETLIKEFSCRLLCYKYIVCVCTSI